MKRIVVVTVRCPAVLIRLRSEPATYQRGDKG